MKIRNITVSLSSNRTVIMSLELFLMIPVQPLTNLFLKSILVVLWLKLHQVLEHCNVNNSPRWCRAGYVVGDSDVLLGVIWLFAMQGELCFSLTKSYISNISVWYKQSDNMQFWGFAITFLFQPEDTCYISLSILQFHQMPS